MERNLGEKDIQIYEFMLGYRQRHGVNPTFCEIVEFADIHRQTVYNKLLKLLRNGYLKITLPTRHRRRWQALTEVEMKYGEEYYKHHCGIIPYGRTREWIELSNMVARNIAVIPGVDSILDAGCAMGLLVESLRALGKEAYGVDISSYAIGKVNKSVTEYCWQGDIVAPFKHAWYDLIVCTDVLEHIDPRYAQTVIDNLAAHTNKVIFSSTPNDTGEPTHINVQPFQYWMDMFELAGFRISKAYDVTYITPWSILLFK